MPPLAASQPLYYDEFGNPIYEDPANAPATAPVPEPMVPAGTAAPPTTTVQYPTAETSTSQYGAPEMAVGYGEQVPSSTPVPAPVQAAPPPASAGYATEPLGGADSYYQTSATGGVSPGAGPGATPYDDRGSAPPYIPDPGSASMYYGGLRSAGTANSFPPGMTYQDTIYPAAGAQPSMTPYTGAAPPPGTASAQYPGGFDLAAQQDLQPGYGQNADQADRLRRIGAGLQGAGDAFGRFDQWSQDFFNTPAGQIAGEAILGAAGPGGMMRGGIETPRVAGTTEALRGAAGRLKDIPIPSIDDIARMAGREVARLPNGRTAPAPAPEALPIPEAPAPRSEPIPEPPPGRNIGIAEILDTFRPAETAPGSRPIPEAPAPRTLETPPPPGRTMRLTEPERPPGLRTVEGGEELAPPGRETPLPPEPTREQLLAARKANIKFAEQDMALTKREAQIAKYLDEQANPGGPYVPAELAPTGQEQIIMPPDIRSNAFDPSLSKAGLKTATNRITNPLAVLGERVGPAIKPAATLAALITGMAGAVKAGQKAEEFAAGASAPDWLSGGEDLREQWRGGGSETAAPPPFRTIGTPYPGVSEAPPEPPYNTLGLSAPQREYGADNPNFPDPYRGRIDEALRGWGLGGAADLGPIVDNAVNAIVADPSGALRELQGRWSGGPGGPPPAVSTGVPRTRSHTVDGVYQPGTDWGGYGTPAVSTPSGGTTTAPLVERRRGDIAIRFDGTTPVEIEVGGNVISVPETIDGIAREDLTKAQLDAWMDKQVAAGGEAPVAEPTATGNVESANRTIAPGATGTAAGGGGTPTGRTLESAGGDDAPSQSSRSGDWYPPRGGGYSSRGGGGYSSRGGGGGYSGGGGFGGFGPNFPFDNVPRPGSGRDSPIRQQILAMLAEMMAGMGQAGGMQTGQMGKKTGKKGEEEEPFLLKSQRGSPYYQPGIRR